MAETRPDQVAEPRTEAGRRLLDELAISAAANAYGHDAQGEGIEYALRSIRRVLPAIEAEARAEAAREALERLAREYEAAASRADDGNLGLNGSLIAGTWRQAAKMAREAGR